MSDESTELADDLDLTTGDTTFGLGAEPGVTAEPGSLEEQLEELLTTLERVTAERDGYLDLAQRLQADFENYKRRVDAQSDELRERAAEALVGELLPVLDACDAAVAHGATEIAPVHAQLEGVLTKRGLAKVAEVDVTFDPNVHEAVMSEPGADDQAGPEVAEVMRAGYLWNGRVVRPAMVKVRG